MNTLDKLKSICHYYDTTRGVGHSFTMLCGAANKDCIIVTSSESVGLHLEKTAGRKLNTVSINSPTMLHGYDKPIAFDNVVLHSLFHTSIMMIEEKEKQVEILDKQLESYKDKVKKLSLELEFQKSKLQIIKDVSNL